MIKVGKKHIEVATKWLPSATLFGLAAGSLMCYMTEWKTVLQNVPYYSGKYKSEE